MFSNKITILGAIDVIPSSYSFQYSLVVEKYSFVYTHPAILAFPAI